MGKIAFLGDSVTKGTDYGGVTAADCYGYKAAAAAGYAPADIINAGVSANTAAMMLARLQTDVIAHAPDVCVVMALINDGYNNVPLVTYQDNLRAIVDGLRAAGIKPVLASPPLYKGAEAFHAKMKTYLVALELVAVEKGVKYIDCYREYAFDYLCGATAFNARYVDSIHQTKAGHTAIAAIIGRDRYAGFLLPDVGPGPDPEPEPSPDLQALSLAVADYLLGDADISAVETERGKFAA